MKTLTTVAVAASMLAGEAVAQSVNFDNLETGAPPPCWTTTKTGSGTTK